MSLNGCDTVGLFKDHCSGTGPGSPHSCSAGLTLTQTQTLFSVDRSSDRCTSKQKNRTETRILLVSGERTWCQGNNTSWYSMLAGCVLVSSLTHWASPEHPPARLCTSSCIREQWSVKSWSCDERRSAEMSWRLPAAASL